MKSVDNIKDLNDIIEKADLCVVVATMVTCGVCKPLKEKVEKVTQEYTIVEQVAVDLDDVPEAKSRLEVYTVPIILIYAGGKEIKRYGSALDFYEFEKVIDRYVSLMQ